MFTFLGAIGSVCFVIVNLALPFVTLYENKRSPRHTRRAMVGSLVLLLALLNVLSWILVVAHDLSMKNPAALSIVLFDLALLVYWWTSLSEKWQKRRNNRKSFLVMDVHA